MSKLYPDERIHKIKEFTELPWGDLDPKKLGQTWSVGRGGHGFDDETWHLTIYSDSNADSYDIWELPTVIGAAFEMVKVAERNRVKHELKCEVARVARFLGIKVE